VTDLARIDREIADCIRLQSDPEIPATERLGALLGEMDWRVERALTLEAPPDHIANIVNQLTKPKQREQRRPDNQGGGAMPGGAVASSW
jgi:hypothetical protein